MTPSKSIRLARPAALLMLALALTVFAGPPVVNNALSVWFVEDDPARVAYEQFQERFGNDEVVVLAVGSTAEPLSEGTWREIERTATRMREVGNVEVVMTARSGAAGPLADLLVDESGGIALVTARLAPMEDADALRHDIIVALREAASGLSASGVETHWAGIGLVYDELNEVSFRETPPLTGASFLIVGVVLYGIVRSVGPVLVTLTGVVVAILIVMGSFTLLGYELNMVTAVLPTLILVVGTANAVHVFTRLRAAGTESRQAALRDVFRPCLFTSLTTAAGFASLATARMAVIRDLGLFAAFGVLVALVTSFAFIGAASNAHWFRIGGTRGTFARDALSRVCDVVVARPRVVLLGAVLLVGVAGWSATSVVVDTYSIEFFRENHPIRGDSEAIEASYGWYLPLEFGVVAPSPGGALEPELVDAVASWQAEVEARELAQWSVSVADFAAAHGAGPAVADPVAARLVDERRSTLRATFGVPMASARGWAHRIAQIREAADGLLPADAELTAGGYLPLYVRMMEYVVETQVRSFATALGLVFLVMTLFLRSARTVLLAVFPNLLPIVLLFGVMGALGIRLDIATVTVGAIALGIVVDDTVHLLYRFREELARTNDPEAAVRAAVLDVGPALVGTTIILATSFAVLGLSSVLSIALFGLLSAATLVFALVADLFVLPAMLVVFSTREREVPVEAGAVS